MDPSVETPLLPQNMLPSPRWNTYLLTLLWASQLGSALFLEYWAVLLLPFFPPRPGHWGSPFLFVWIVGNLLVLISVPVEAWQYGIEALTSSRYLKLQAAKNIWMVSAFVTFAIFNSEHEGFSPVIYYIEWILVVFSPFICSLVYAGIIHLRFIRHTGTHHIQEPTDPILF
jgi:hypothetical protein